MKKHQHLTLQDVISKAKATSTHQTNNNRREGRKKSKLDSKRLFLSPKHIKWTRNSITPKPLRNDLRVSTPAVKNCFPPSRNRITFSDIRPSTAAKKKSTSGNHCFERKKNIQKDIFFRKKTKNEEKFPFSKNLEKIKKGVIESGAFSGSDENKSQKTKEKGVLHPGFEVKKKFPFQEKIGFSLSPHHNRQNRVKGMKSKTDEMGKFISLTKQILVLKKVIYRLVNELAKYEENFSAVKFFLKLFF